MSAQTRARARARNAQPTRPRATGLQLPPRRPGRTGQRGRSPWQTNTSSMRGASNTAANNWYLGAAKPA
eukprot:2868319-Lingulodinium_polyedra.AAC.1